MHSLIAPRGFALIFRSVRRVSLNFDLDCHDPKIQPDPTGSFLAVIALSLFRVGEGLQLVFYIPLRQHSE
jgi:hypothetical protein